MEVEVPQIPEILQGCDVSEDLGVGEVEVPQIPEILQSRNVAGGLGVVEVERRQLPEILQCLNVTRDFGFSEVEDLQVWQFAEARTQGAGEVKAPIQIDLHHFAAIPRWLLSAEEVSWESMELKKMDDALRRKVHVSRVSVSENHPT